MDRIDDAILRELSQDGRISNLALADRVGLSPSACLRRVQELERSGIIVGYRAVLDRAKLDPALASGTFVTTVTDVVGFAAFLGLATLVLL